MKENGQGRPERPCSSQRKTTQPERQAHGKGISSPEHQLLLGVWDVLERQVRLWAPGQPSMNKEKYFREAREVKLLKEEIEEKGTDREKLIFTLFELDKRTFRPDRPGTDILNLSGTDPRSIFLKELQQFRSRVEPLSDEELAMEVRQLESFWRRLNEGTKE